MKSTFKKIIVFIIQLEAKIVLKKYKPKIVAITGSVGKTTAKDAIFTVLSSAFFVRKSEKSFNSEIGVPLSILGCPNGGNNIFIWLKNIFEGLALILFKNHYPKWLVLEVGADHPNDIEDIAKWLKPDIAVITRFAEIPVHVEYFDSPDAVIQEKKKLVRYLKEDGYIILNYDDKDVLKIKEENDQKTITYGLENDEADIWGSNNQFSYKEGKVTGMVFKANSKGTSVPVNMTGVIGVQHIYPALAAIAVGISQGLNLVSMSQALSEDHLAQPGRMNLIEGIKNSIIIDDSYNSSPLAVEWALKMLGEVEAERKIAVLGDMMELGEYATEEHKKAGKIVAGICDILLVVGLRAKDIAEGAHKSGMNKKNIFEFDDSQKAGAFLQNLIKEKDLILVKGSRWATRMEFVVEEVMAHPEKADELLVR